RPPPRARSSASDRLPPATRAPSGRAPPPRARASRPRPSASGVRCRRRPMSSVPRPWCAGTYALRGLAASRLNPEAIQTRGLLGGDSCGPGNGIVSGRAPCCRVQCGDCKAVTLPSSLLSAVRSPADSEPSPKARRGTLDAQKRAFLRVVSHELRTPLNSIIGFSEILSKELCGPMGSPQYVEYANHIRQSGLKLLKLVNQVLEIARLEGRATDLEPIAEPLDHAVDDVLEGL